MEADIIVSTASHEFFGVAVVEAIAAGTCPLLPNRLAYPEILGASKGLDPTPFLYDGTISDLSDSLKQLAARLESESLQDDDLAALQGHIAELEYARLAPRLDSGLEEVLSETG